MSQGSLNTNTTWTENNAFQADVQTPANIPQNVDTGATQYVQQNIKLLTGVSMTFPVSSAWSKVRDVHLVNTDLTGYILVTMPVGSTGNNVTLVLNPNGGSIALNNYVGGSQAVNVLNPQTWTLKGVTSDGNTTSPNTVYAYLYATGI